MALSSGKLQCALDSKHCMDLWEAEGAPAPAPASRRQAVFLSPPPPAAYPTVQVSFSSGALSAVHHMSNASPGLSYGHEWFAAMHNISRIALEPAPSTGARLTSGQAQQLLGHEAQARKNQCCFVQDKCAARGPVIPRVAFLFMTMGAVVHEAMWKEWFRYAVKHPSTVVAE